MNSINKLNYQPGDINSRTSRHNSLRTLLDRYIDVLWEPGPHRYNVSSFVGQLDEILFGAEFSDFTDEKLDTLISALRRRGNSNATINRKMAALSKLLRKAHKMGDMNRPGFAGGLLI